MPESIINTGGAQQEQARRSLNAPTNAMQDDAGGDGDDNSSMIPRNGMNASRYGVRSHVNDFLCGLTRPSLISRRFCMFGRVQDKVGMVVEATGAPMAGITMGMEAACSEEEAMVVAMADMAAAGCTGAGCTGAAACTGEATVATAATAATAEGCTALAMAAWEWEWEWVWGSAWVAWAKGCPVKGGHSVLWAAHWKPLPACQVFIITSSLLLQCLSRENW